MADFFILPFGDIHGDLRLGVAFSSNDGQGFTLNLQVVGFAGAVKRNTVNNSDVFRDGQFRNPLDFKELPDVST